MKRAFFRAAIGAICVFSSLSSLALQTNLETPTQPAFPTKAEFQQCLQRLEGAAKQAGVEDERALAVLSSASFVEKVIGYDRRQPEFVQTFPNYLNKRVTTWRIDKGRQLLSRHRDYLRQLTSEYGVPPHYLMAFWGLETNFGTIKGKMPVIDSLATLACDQRRSAFFTNELILALKLLARENLSPELMVGSWAGAMGHTQFMPSAYLAYALDGDNDARVDLWDSELDALRSAANFLHSLGWQRGIRWGREVLLPDNFDYSLAGKQQKRPLEAWSELGVTKTDGSPLGKVDIQASLLVPAGHEGPAFLVYKNFDVIMRWNNSQSYALAVGYLADRIRGMPALHAQLPEQPDFAIDQMKAVQHALNQLGFDVGEADGIFGPATRAGIRAFQVANDQVADGYPSAEIQQKIVDKAAKSNNSGEG